MTPGKIISSIKRSYQLARQCRYPGLSYRIKIFRILLRLHLKSHAGHTGKNIVEHIFGFRITARSYQELLYLFVETAVKLQYQFVSTNPSPRIIDCGANIGMSVLFLKFLYPRSLILAFEPDPETYKLLEKNMRQNKIRNVKLFNACLSAHDETVKFYPHVNSLLSSLNPCADVIAAVDVRSMKLSALLSDQHYDMAKIDAEGAEWGILRDIVASQTIGNVRQYFVAYHHSLHEKSSGIGEFSDLFDSNGFTPAMRWPHYDQAENSPQATLISCVPKKSE